MDVFSALAEPRRRTIIELLAQSGTLSSTEISDKFKVSSAAISQHLKVLREANIVVMEKQAQKHFYKINPDAMNEIEQWLQKVTKTWERRLDRIDDILEREKRRLDKKI